MKPIASAAQMTPEWLTHILYRHGSLTQGHVVSVAAQGSPSNAAEGPGFDSRHRMTLHYSSDATPSAPTRLYLNWWGHPQLGQSIGALPIPEAIRADFAQLGNVFPAYVDYLGDRLSAERRRVYEGVLEQYPAVLSRHLAQHATLTLVYHDAHAGNFLLPCQAAGQQVYLIDWQQWDVYSGIRDVAYLIALFWYPERRARMEQPVVKRYHERLRAHGVEGYDWQACWDDYRFQAINNLFVPFWAWAFEGEHWGFHRWHQLEKAMLAFEDLNSEEFLA